jgi:GH25 family lysozyme M1 (1,4-beta-N-acetylmuramidase)
LKIIDISKHNWNAPIDFKKVKASGIDGVIIRAGYGRVISQKDPQFEAAYSGAKAAGLNVGAYWYSYADTPSDAVTEANTCLTAINGKKFELPVYFDIEELKHSKMTRLTCTQMVKNFCGALEESNYFAGVYSFDSFFGSNLDAGISSQYTAWVARVENVKPTYCKKYDMHQYSWKGKIDGIKGDVDMNDCFRDFPAIIKNAGLNGFEKIPVATPPSSAPDKYKVGAEISGLSQAEANAIKSACVKLGMNVSMIKHK